MGSPLNALSPGVFEGAFTNCVNPRTQVLGGAGQLRAGVGNLLASPGGVIVGRFGWAADDGLAFNAKADTATAGARLGVVLPCAMPGVNNSWQRTYSVVLPSGRFARVIRPGLEVTMCNKADLWLKFEGGAYPGQPVYASRLDGSAIAGYDSNSDLTPWSVLTSARPGGLAAVSTWSNFT